MVDHLPEIHQLTQEISTTITSPNFFIITKKKSTPRYVKRPVFDNKISYYPRKTSRKRLSHNLQPEISKEYILEFSPSVNMNSYKDKHINDIEKVTLNKSNDFNILRLSYWNPRRSIDLSSVESYKSRSLFKRRAFINNPINEEINLTKSKNKIKELLIKKILSAKIRQKSNKTQTSTRIRSILKSINKKTQISDEEPNAQPIHIN